MTTRTEAIKQFLLTTPSPLAKWYSAGMEVQVNVLQGRGVRETGTYNNRKYSYWVDKESGERWRNLRIPRKANSEPEYDLSIPQTFSLRRHAEGIGMTGWNWQERSTQWVGFDFDSIANHKAGIPEEEIEIIKDRCMSLDYLTVVKSTSGKGLHIYIKFGKSFPTSNHNEHAAVARSLLGVLSADLGYNLKASVDCVGSILWVWHLKMEGTDGLTILKEASKEFDTKKIPTNWKEHLSVISRKRDRISTGVAGAQELSSAIQEVAIDNHHHSILLWFSSHAKRNWWWDSDNFMMIGHTKDFEDCHTALKLRGLYKTDSSESSPQNCFAFPLKDGKFILRRFGSNVQEHSSWTTDEKGWTKTMFNEKPTFLKTMLYYGGLLNEKGEVVFPSLKFASASLSTLGINLPFSVQLENRQTKVKFIKKEAIVSVKVGRETGDSEEPSWILENKRWEKVVAYSEEDTLEKLDVNVDEYIRHTVTSGADSGWWINIQETWVEHPRPDVGNVLRYIIPDLKGNDIVMLMGKAVLNPWFVVAEPFKEEYLGGRKWNRNAAQLAFIPRDGIHPTWDSLLRHTGSGLNVGVKEDIWCTQNGMETGADFLFTWISFMFQHPKQPLPFLSLSGVQNTGKSSLHEALSLLFKDRTGYMDAGLALKSKGGFNSELAGAVLAYIEEIDLNKDVTAYNKVKDWVTSPTLTIHGKGDNPYQIENTLHFIQVSNDSSYTVVFDGDTRIIMWEVPTLATEIPKALFMEKLKEEAPMFLKSVLGNDLPSLYGRLALPCVETELKASTVTQNMNELERFISEEYEHSDGECVPFSQVKSYFKTWLSTNGLANKIGKWSDIKISSHFPKWNGIVKGNLPSKKNHIYIGNLTLKGEKNKDTKGVWGLEGKKLVLKEKKDEFI